MTIAAPTPKRPAPCPQRGPRPQPKSRGWIVCDLLLSEVERLSEDNALLRAELAAARERPNEKPRLAPG